MTAEEWRDWSYLCRWIALFPPDRGVFDLKSKFYLSRLPAKYRKELALMANRGGWGWRLLEGWEERLEALRPDGIVEPPLIDCAACQGTGFDEAKSIPNIYHWPCLACRGTGKEL